MRVCGQPGVGLNSQRAVTSAWSRFARACSTAVSSAVRRSRSWLRSALACVTAGVALAERAACWSMRRSMDPENSATAASSPTTRPTSTATAARPATAQPRVGPLAAARLTAPTSTPNSSINGKIAHTGHCMDWSTATVAASQASAAPSSTTAPAIEAVERS